ncbi:hypothetical protein EA462_01775 [Natrarchaeobius halalkaliphilus]|uniref:DUF7967 domain-containing protein n=1 Tax=Natrarchaeobius halalkaliphilus TaxID=1679091 RepID=A0A3N6P4Q3_9EURY|nr:hypothetical protein [Natrarchaeobius halalkaliphilus]RQG92969.1 hypothetical protein EA462_01775 [Natrarchaeobius halalkaliphilus]
MDDSSERCWLVEREFGDRNVVTIVYATPDGTRYHQRERSEAALRTGSPVTAAVDVAEDDLEEVRDERTRERYVTEVERTAQRYGPDEKI